MQKQQPQPQATTPSLVTPADWKRVSPIEKVYTKLPETLDQHWGRGKLFENKKNGQKIFARDRVTNSKEEGDRFIAAIKRRMKVQNPGLATLHDFSATINSGFCSKNYLVTDFWDASHNDLEREITAREKKGSGFNDEELTYILYQTTHGLAALNDANYNHGEVQPSCIDLDSSAAQKHHYKLMDAPESRGSMREKAYNRLTHNKELFCAPEVFESLKALRDPKAPKNYIDPQTADSFSLGMTILRAGTMDKLDDCYKKDSGAFDQAALGAHLQKFNEQFKENPLLIESVENLLAVEPSKRWNACYLRSEFPTKNEIDSCFNEDQPQTTEYNQTQQGAPLKSTPPPPNDLPAGGPSGGPVYGRTAASPLQQPVSTQYKPSAQPVNTQYRSNAQPVNTQYRSSAQPVYSNNRIIQQGAPVHTYTRYRAQQPVTVQPLPQVYQSRRTVGAPVQTQPLQSYSRVSPVQSNVIPAFVPSRRVLNSSQPVYRSQSRPIQRYETRTAPQPITTTTTNYPVKQQSQVMAPTFTRTTHYTQSPSYTPNVITYNEGLRGSRVSSRRVSVQRYSSVDRAPPVTVVSQRQPYMGQSTVVTYNGVPSIRQSHIITQAPPVTYQTNCFQPQPVQRVVNPNSQRIVISSERITSHQPMTVTQTTVGASSLSHSSSRPVVSRVSSNLTNSRVQPVTTVHATARRIEQRPVEGNLVGNSRTTSQAQKAGVENTDPYQHIDDQVQGDQSTGQGERDLQFQEGNPEGISNENRTANFPQDREILNLQGEIAAPQEREGCTLIVEVPSQGQPLNLQGQTEAPQEQEGCTMVMETPQAREITIDENGNEIEVDAVHQEDREDQLSNQILGFF